MKRWAVVLSGLVLGAGLLAACGGDAADGDRSAGASPAAGKSTDALGPSADGFDVRDAASEAPAPGRAGAGGVPAQPPAAAATPTGAYGSTAATPNQVGDLTRKIVFNSSMDLSVQDVPAAFTEAARIARSYGGFVERSSVSQREDGDGKEQTYAAITVRIPVQNYDDALNQYRGLTGGKVQREESKSTEVTEQYVDLQARQRNLERSEQQYLELLKNAKTPQEILQISDRIDNIRNQIEQAKGRLRVLDQLTDLASISLNIAPLGAAKAAKAGSGPGNPVEVFVDALEWSVEALRYAGAAAAVLAVAALWVAIPAGAVFFGSRRFRSHRGTEA